MSPNLETKNSNCTHCIHHSNVSKHWFTRKKTLHMTHNTKSRQNQYINFGMPKKPKQMLVLNNITTPSRQEERSVEITVCKKHSQPCSKNGKTSNLQNTNKTNRPYKQRQTIQSHSLGTHVSNGHKKINASLNTSNTCNVQTKNSLVYRCSRMTQCTTKRRICCPSYTGSLFNQSTQNLQCKSHRKDPKTNVIHSRKSHIRGTNHHWNKPISKPTHQSRHYNKKQHQQPVCCNLNIIKLSVPRLNSRTNITKFHSNLQTHGCCNHTNPSCKNKVHHTNVFCISTTKPSNKQIIPFIIHFSHIFVFFSKKEIWTPTLMIMKHTLCRLSYFAFSLKKMYSFRKEDCILIFSLVLFFWTFPKRKQIYAKKDSNPQPLHP